MNIKLIKAELEKLSLMLSAWESEESVSAIERDIALDKLKTLYDLVRFDTTTQPSTPVAPATTTESKPAEEVTDNEEKDVEVELIFAEDDDMFTLPSAEQSEEEASEDAESPISLASEILSAAIGTSAPEVVVPIAQQAEPTTFEEEISEQPEPEEEPEEECELEIEPTTSSEPEEITPEPTPVAEPIPAPAVEPTPVAEKSVEREEPQTLNSLFGMEEVQRRPRTKHQRMMSIYSDSEARQEKVVDISKIFDMEIDAPIPMTSKITEFAPEPTPVKPAVATTASEPEAERPKTLADAISASTQTLADTLATPTPLGEEILNSRIASLRDGIGLNDKFLMIRDLFDGDDEAYNEAISALDELETMDDCMIHIIENYAWNPDSEGSKFIMQLLERKLS